MDEKTELFDCVALRNGSVRWEREKTGGHKITAICYFPDNDSVSITSNLSWEMAEKQFEIDVILLIHLYHWGGLKNFKNPFM